MQNEAWRRRPLEVRVLELCDHCNTLQEYVEKREHKSYWPTYTLSLKSCAPCFEVAKREKAAEFNVSIC